MTTHLNEVIKLSYSTEYRMEKRKVRTFLRDLKLLVKGLVLIANVLPIISGFWLALYYSGSSFSAYWEKFLIVAIGGAFVIAGALIINNWYEVDLDKAMDRTKARPTVTGSFTLQTVLILGLSFSAIGFIFMLFTTIEAFIYAFLGWFIYVVPYTLWTKRKYTLNTVVGSISGAFTPLIGWAIVETAFHIVPLAVFVILFLWQIPHTFAIAMRRYDDYKAAKVPMLPVAYGFDITKRQMALYIAAMLPFPFFLIDLGIVYVVIVTIINIIWLISSIRGLFSSENEAYANRMFYYSLTYLTFVFGLMIILTLPIFN